MFAGKFEAELAFWRSRLERDHGHFGNTHYPRILLGMAGEPDAEFLRGKVVGDFGCGPRGSLAWATPAALRVGIDVLADRYADLFTSNILSHGMLYVKSTEHVIPIPAAFFDVMFTLNAIDHVDDFPGMCAEIVRVLKPGGLFIGSFNLEEPATPLEPQCLSEKYVSEHLLAHLVVDTYRVALPGPDDDEYANFLTGNLGCPQGQRGFLWVRAHKPG